MLKKGQKYRSAVLTARKLRHASELLASGTLKTLAEAARLLNIPLEVLSKHLYRNGEFRVAPGRNVGCRRSNEKLELMGQLVRAGASRADIQARLKITPEQYRRFFKKLSE